MPYLTQEALEGLKRYKYKGEDRSIIHKYLFKWIWDRLVYVFPLWVAPNLITLMGFGSFIIGYLFAVIYTPTLTEDYPRWVPLVYAAGITGWMWLDNLDGRQARRTGTGSPLGEMFDHGVDSMCLTMGYLMLLSVFKAGIQFWSIVLFVVIYTGFFCATWEEYQTGKMILPEVNGAVEGVVLNIVTMIVAAIVPGFWNESVLETLHISPTSQPFVNSLQNWHIFPIFLAIALFPTLYSNFTHALEHHSSVRGKKNISKIEKEKEITIVDFLPLLFFLLIGVDTATLFPGPEKVLYHNIHFVFCAFGLAFASCLTRLILAYCTEQFYDVNGGLLAVLFSFVIRGSLMLNFEPMYVRWAIRSSFGILLCYHGHFILSLVGQITSYLDIFCLSIKSKKNE